jgi:quinol monooxygenase YgiN
MTGFWGITDSTRDSRGYAGRIKRGGKERHMFARVVVYKFRQGSVDGAVKKAEAGLVPIFRAAAGFHGYEVIRAGADSIISISHWDSPAQAQAAVNAGADWVKKNIADSVVSAETYVGEVAFSQVK